jgi:hypothetical protein
MKWLIIFLAVVPTIGFTQQVGFSLGTNMQNLAYTNSAGVKSEQLVGLPAASISFSYMQRLQKKSRSKALQNNYLVLQAGYKTGQLKDKGSHLLTTWSMNFISGSLNFVSQHNTKRKTNPFYGAGVVNDLLISGTQNRGFEQYDLTNDLKSFNLSAKIFTGLSYRISDEANCSLELNYLRGLRNIEKSQGQSALLHAWQLSATLFLHLKNKK